MIPASPHALVDPLLEQRVRFDEQCVLIPDIVFPSRMSRLVRKSYSLPLWKRRPHEHQSDLDPFESSSTEDDYVVLKPSVPRLTSKSQSPMRLEAHQPLVSCIVNSPASAPHPRRTRSASVSTSPRADCVTIPLRKCCTNCIHYTEECLEQGDAWTEHFTRGAQRLRNSSVDSPRRARQSQQHRLCDSMPGFDVLVAVDEVDRRHGSRGVDPRLADLADVPALDPNSEEGMALPPSLSRSGRDRGPKPIVHTESSDLLFPLPRRSSASSPVSESPSSASSDITSRSPYTPSQDVTADDSPRPIHALPSIKSLSFNASNRDTHPKALAPSMSMSSGDIFDPAYSSSTPSSALHAPRQSHHRQASEDTFTQHRKRSLAQYLGPASFLRASADLLKGVSAIGGGMPLAA